MNQWCEHCRDHFPADHYPDGQHATGFEYGPVGAALVAEQIVRALAANGAPWDGKEGDCAFCYGPGRGDDFHDPASHTPDCLWRLAREWVSAVEQRQ